VPLLLGLGTARAQIQIAIVGDGNRMRLLD
jgi:hypothetical protein